MKKICKNCALAEWQRGKASGRVIAARPGKCGFVLPEVPALPISVVGPPQVIRKTSIWRDDTRECPVFSPIDPEGK